MNALFMLMLAEVILMPYRKTNGNFEVGWYGQTNVKYTLQSSTNAGKTWQTVSNVQVVHTNCHWHFVEVPLPLLYPTNRIWPVLELTNKLQVPPWPQIKRSP